MSSELRRQPRPYAAARPRQAFTDQHIRRADLAPPRQMRGVGMVEQVFDPGLQRKLAGQRPIAEDACACHPRDG